MFSHNGIATVANENRLLILGEVARVRWSGGVFSFSTHNLNSRNRRTGFQWTKFESSGNPARLLMRLARFGQRAPLRLTHRHRLRD